MVPSAALEIFSARVSTIRLRAASSCASVTTTAREVSIGPLSATRNHGDARGGGASLSGAPCLRRLWRGARPSVTITYPAWWASVRPSNTEPLLRLNVEADTHALMEEKRDALLQVIRQA
jgi:phosphomannomutase